MQLVVDISRMRHNIRYIKSVTKKRFCAVVKSNAYGHGAVVAKYIEPVCDGFFVATADEAWELVYLGVKKPVIVLGGEIAPFTRKYSPLIVPSVCDALQLDTLIKSGYNNFQVAVNTGMNRLGANEKSLNEIVSLCKMNNLAPRGVYSHLYNGISSAPEQSELFERLTADPILRRDRHLYCSCALSLIGCELYDTVRIGLAMYGYALGVEPCMKARARIVRLSRVSRGSHVGYGDCILERDSIIATVGCGYNDGLRRTDSPLYMTVRGVKCPVVGHPCMDVTMIDVTNVNCRVGEFAYIISCKEDTEYLAKCYGTIIYEVLTGFNGRAERFYI